MSSSVTRPEESSEVPSSEPAGAGLLANLPLLDGLPDQVSELVERSFVRFELEFGEAVVRQGDPRDAYYVIAAGTARVVVENEDGQEVSLNVLGPGDAFGEAALLEGTPRTATVRASHPLTVLRLDRGVFQALVDSYPSVGEAFSLNARTRRVNDFLRLHSAFSVLDRDETIKLPILSRVAARVEGKSSLARLGIGIHITAPTIHAGFEGPIQLEICNHGTVRVRLLVGMPVCQLIFEQTLGTPHKGYTGQFLGQKQQ